MAAIPLYHYVLTFLDVQNTDHAAQGSDSPQASTSRILDIPITGR
jgi:hypothetical protein